MDVSKKLLWQQGAVAQYAEIHLAVDPSGSEVISVIIPNNVSPHWSNAIRFAVALFTESFAWQHPSIAKMTVRVQSIKAVPGDTTLLSLAYVTFQALCAAWSLDGEKVFAFDQSSGIYSFNLPILGITSSSSL